MYNVRHIGLGDTDGVQRWLKALLRQMLSAAFAPDFLALLRRIKVGLLVSPSLTPRLGHYCWWLADQRSCP